MENKQLKWVFLTILALVWGSSFILIKKGLLALTGFQVGSLRIIFASTFLLLIGFKSLKKISKKQWKFIIFTSFFGTFFPAFLFAIAQKHISSSVSAVLNSLTPINTLLLGALAFKVGINKNQIIGVIAGLLGSLVLILSGAADHPEQNYWYSSLVIAATICYATNVNLLKKHLSDLSPLTITAGNFSIIVLPAIFVLFCTGFFNQQLNGIEIQKAIFFIAILGVVGTGIANIIFFRLIQISSPVFATSVTYLIPVVAFCWGLIDNEKLSLMQVFGAAIILTGIWLAAKK